MEYLAPGVYLEEVSSGNKPIEGASTSTAGMVGVTQRGPVNQPTLVTSFGDFTRLFGGFLDHRDFTQHRDALPYAAQGFFNNGGQRLYISRIIGPNATFSSTDIFAQPVANQANTTLSQRSAANTNTLVVDDDSNIGDTDQLLLVDDVRSEYVTVAGTPATNNTLRTAAGLRLAASNGDAVAAQTVTEGADLTAEIAGDMIAGGGLQLEAAAVAALTAGQILRVSDSDDPGLTEYVTITGAAAADFDEGGLLFDHPQTSTELRTVTIAAAAASDTLNADAAAGAALMSVADSAGFAIGDVVQVNGAELTILAGVPSTVTLTANLNDSHASGVAVQKQLPMLRVRALYQGLWGNLVRARVRLTNMLETATTNAVTANNNVIVLDALFGLTAGSIVEFSDGTNVLQTLQVESVNRVNNEVTFTTDTLVDLPAGTQAVSKEYNLIIERMEAGKVVQTELFENLGLHPNHNRYGPRVVGSFNRGSGVASDSGESELIRISDLSVDNDGADIAAIAANRSSALSDLVPRMLDNGIDDLANIDDQAYIGSPTPGALSGIHSLESEESISIVAVPGRTGVNLQKTLIGHCEKMRYRFAVLDTPRNLNQGEAITHRQNYDTTRAAIYYPWLVMPDLFGERGDLLPIAPAGHVMGIYARTDTSRGVWKAPANEVVRGILQFERVVTKGEQDLLNPAHVNAFRDFRTANRGLRLWGARTASSDPEWKYINVRRLFLFLEQSIERGMQFAVFEPNNETLWATVKQSISNFLIGVWRNGGLEGVKEEEAFFVNVGYNVTMTQTDIDNGRLIVEVGVAPVKPAEFVIIRISQKTREATA